MVIRVLHVVGRMDMGGAETLLMNLFRHIDRSKVQFDFLVHSSHRGIFDEEIGSLGGRIFPLQKPQVATLMGYGIKLRRLLDQHGPFAAIHSHVFSFSGYVLYVSQRAGIPLRIAHSHNTSDGKPDVYLRSVYKRFMRMLIFRSATHMFACSQPASIALYGARALDDPRVSLIPNAIDLTLYRNLPSNRELRKELSLSAGDPLVGHIGSFRPQKNHTFLIGLMAELLTRIPSAQLLLVGDGALRRDTESLVKEKGIGDHVHFLGIRSDVPRILGALDLFLLPSLYEGLAIVLIEAQAAGVPSLTSDALPPEADLGLGLIKSAALQSGAGVWVDLIADLLTISRLPWMEREVVLRRSGYDIETLANHLQGIYLDA